MFWSRAQHETEAGASPADLEQGAAQAPTHRGPQPGNPVVEAGPAAADEDMDASEHAGRLEPSQKLTRHQVFYILVLDGLGGMLLSGGVNFALAYAMYTTQDTVQNPVRLFQLPNTLAGDAAVTIIVQCILTWFVEKGLVAYDLSKRSVQPIGFIPEPTLRWQRWLFFLPTSAGNDAADVETKGEVELKGEVEPKVAAPARFSTLTSLLQQALRGFFLAIVGFVLLWPAGVGILTAFGKHSGGDYTYADRWTPQVFKFILGGLLGLLTTPLMAAFWLIKAGWEDKSEQNSET
ncbi:hypothetical protein G7Z17_g6342 [Cylindrodendrum hubeiense]|uniref:Uncharacterized protein n=1 Tax=Cylindrodendrum hubeiense TaxID=595255 RepID=A0A9P5HB63_9HYPO|nr:hypothetical protein G7Z17_g6342 [Cylindrodendrum hubeiense]